MDEEIIKVRIDRMREDLTKALAALAANTYMMQSFIEKTLERLEVLENDIFSAKTSGQDE